ncbi:MULTISPECIES: hypothetical protein [Providencia]|uniref:Uncharacterized protein n=1 Tax=Providencia rettgeri TaxID=587 RepID=A0AAW6UN23_PRORE|nr:MULTISPECIES: hypothetical protein [unclassified Providencia]MDI9095008.1 hypothetical protein [Providencia rettgeri]
MNHDIYCMGKKGHKPFVVAYGKKYLFIATTDSELTDGYDGYIFPYLCTYIVADSHLKPIAIIMTGKRIMPELMDADWNGKNQLPTIKPQFTRESILNVPHGVSMNDLTLTLLKACRQAHLQWSDNSAEQQPYVDPMRRTVTLFNETYVVSKDISATKKGHGVIYHDPEEGFIFINEQEQAVFSLVDVAGITSFSSVASVAGRVTSMLVIDDSDLGKLGGEILRHQHRLAIAERLHDVLTLQFGIQG